jgi:hypothetical protein
MRRTLREAKTRRNGARAFALWPHGARRRANRETNSNTNNAHQTRETALVLAKRLEALSRLQADCKPYILRMALLLAAREDTAFTAFAPFRFPGPVGTLFAETQAQVGTALANTS